MTSEINERVWFYYAGEEQVGPLLLGELHDAISNGEITERDYVYREGFGDWKLLSDVPELHQMDSGTFQDNAATQLSTPEKRGDLRVSIKERVVAHNDSLVASGALTDISISGVFFQTTQQCFSVNEEIKITLKEGKGLGKPMHLRGTVVRSAHGTGKQPGYGLELKNLDDHTRASIVEYVKRNQAF